MEHMGDETIHDQIVQQYHTDEFVLNCDAIDIFEIWLFRTNFLSANSYDIRLMHYIVHTCFLLDTYIYMFELAYISTSLSIHTIFETYC